MPRSGLCSELRGQKINVVSFDFDLTLTREHLFDKLGNKDEPIRAEKLGGVEGDDLETLCKNALVDHEFIRALFTELQKNGITVAINSLGVESQIRKVLNHAQIPFDKMFASESYFDVRGGGDKWRDFIKEYKDIRVCHFDDDPKIVDFFDNNRTKEVLGNYGIGAIGIQVKAGVGICCNSADSLLRNLKSCGFKQEVPIVNYCDRLAEDIPGFCGNSGMFYTERLMNERAQSMSSLPDFGGY